MPVLEQVLQWNSAIDTKTSAVDFFCSYGLVQLGQSGEVVRFDEDSLCDLAFVWFLSLLTGWKPRFLRLDDGWSVVVYEGEDWKDRFVFPWRNRTYWHDPFGPGLPLRTRSQADQVCQLAAVMGANRSVLPHLPAESPLLKCDDNTACSDHVAAFLCKLQRLSRDQPFSPEFVCLGGPAFAVHAPSTLIEALHSETGYAQGHMEHWLNSFFALVLAKEMAAKKVAANVRLTWPISTSELDIVVCRDNALISAEVSLARSDKSKDTKYPNKFTSALALHSISFDDVRRGYNIEGDVQVARIHLRVSDPSAQPDENYRAACTSLQRLGVLKVVDCPVDRSDLKRLDRLSRLRDVFDQLVRRLRQAAAAFFDNREFSQAV